MNVSVVERLVGVGRELVLGQRRLDFADDGADRAVAGRVAIHLQRAGDAAARLSVISLTPVPALAIRACASRATTGAPAAV